MRRHHDARTTRERLVGLAGRLGARAGGLRFTGGDMVKLEPFGLLKDLEKALGEPELLASISLGPRRRNRKPVLQLLRPDGEAVGFAKVGWSDLTRGLVGNEGNWLSAVDGNLPPGLIAPKVLHRVSTPETDLVPGTDLVVTTPLDINDRASRKGPLDPSLVLGLARSCGSGHHLVGDLAMHTHWRSTIGEAVDVDAFVHRHGQAKIEVGLWHGDFTPWNTATTNGQTMLWDWEFTDDNRPVGLDLLHNRFEEIRRAAVGNERLGLNSIETEHLELLEPVLAPLPAADKASVGAAIVDSYFCELVARETLLAGEGWVPDNLGDLAGPAAQILARRLQ